MKIVSVECFMGPFITMKINTDAGISGFGEPSLSFGKCRLAVWGNCQEFAKTIIGMDPFDTEKIWENLYRETFWGMNGGVTVTSAMSAIDMACWDIKGKALGVPVYKLLGGKTNSKLQAYASQLQFGWRSYIEKHDKLTLLYDPQDYYDVVKDAMADGYKVVKLNPVFAAREAPIVDGSAPGEVFKVPGVKTRGYYPVADLKCVVERVAAAREAGGEDLGIIIELHSLLDANTAAVLGRELEPYRILCFEEPTMPSNPSVYRHIKEKCNIPLATGERCYTRWGIRQFFEDRTLDIVQPDLCNTGGFTETKKICDMAHVYDVGVQLHCSGGPISTAAALHLEAAIPNFVIHEEHNANFKTVFKKSGKYVYETKDGMYDIPELPGIGQEMSEWAMENSTRVIIE